MPVVEHLRRVVRGGITWWEGTGFASNRDLHVGFSTRRGGVSRGAFETLNVSFRVGDDALFVRENRLLLARAVRFPRPPVLARQVHGGRVLWVKNEKSIPSGEIGEGDALITRLRGVPLGVLAADCLPIIFWDPENKAIGVAHAGWRGVLAQIAVHTVRALHEAFGSDPQALHVLFGPCLRECCMEVGPDVWRRVEAAVPGGEKCVRQALGDRKMLNLPQTVKMQLLSAGLKEDHFRDSGLCTAAKEDDFFSHRIASLSGKTTGRFLAWAMLP